MDIAKYLNYRSEYETLVSGFVLPDDKYHGTISNMQWFLQKGHTANRFRKGFDKVTDICNTVIEEFKHE